MRIRDCRSGWMLAIMAAVVAQGGDAVAMAATAKVSPDEAREIAVEAYVYAYPLVLMELSRRVMTNVETVTPDGLAPMNQFGNKPKFPDASFTDVVRPNADTLYSLLWFDVSREPLIISVPDSEGRYYLLQLLDMWSDVFASPGTRTTGNGAQSFALVAPDWQGQLPSGVREIRCPTNVGWLFGRTQTNGPADYKNVHTFQNGLSAVPLSSWGKNYTPPPAKVDLSVSGAAPVEQVGKMDAAMFFAMFAELARNNPPHANDYPILARMKRIGLEPGQPFDLKKTPPQVRSALEQAVKAGPLRIIGHVSHTGQIVNGWRLVPPPIGTYGTDYLTRATIARFGLGANVCEDAIYPTAVGDAAGKPFDSGSKYVMHFTKEQLPPVRSFWSLTMYNNRQFFAANPIDRYAIGDRDPLKFNDDGSLTLYMQREPPGKDRESNWLPTPAEGSFSMTMRLYWPEPTALYGAWAPPEVEKVE